MFTNQHRLRYVPEHFFISYSREDEAEAHKIKRALEARGIHVWLDTWAISFGSRNWEEDIRKAIRSSFAVILLASNSSRQSLNVLGELSIAQTYNCPIYPLWIKGDKWSECVPIDLIKAQYIDCRTDQFQQGFLELVEELNKVIKNRAVNHFVLNPDEDVPFTYLEVKLTEGLRLAFRPESYPTLASFLSDLFINYLSKQYKPFSYSLDWFIAGGDNSMSMYLMNISRVILPWSWLRSFSQNKPYEFEPGWDNTALSKWGLVSYSSWRVTDLQPNYVFGVATNHAGIAEEIDSLTRIIPKPGSWAKRPYFRFVAGKWKSVKDVGDFPPTQESTDGRKKRFLSRSMIGSPFSSEYFKWIFMADRPIKHNGMVLLPSTQYYHELFDMGESASVEIDPNWEL